MLPVGNTITTERQARALAAVPEERREEVLSKAAESGSVTAKSITEAARDSDATEDEPLEQEAVLHRVVCAACQGLGYVEE